MYNSVTYVHNAMRSNTQAPSSLFLSPLVSTI